MPDGITELKLYYCNKNATLDYSKPIKTIKVKTGDKEYFCFSSFGTTLGHYLVQYQINDENPIIVGDMPTKFVLTWS